MVLNNRKLFRKHFYFPRITPDECCEYAKSTTTPTLKLEHFNRASGGFADLEDVPNFPGDRATGEYLEKVALLSRNEDTWKSFTWSSNPSPPPSRRPWKKERKKEREGRSHSESWFSRHLRSWRASRNRRLVPVEKRRPGQSRGLVVGRGLRRDGSFVGRPAINLHLV